MLQCQNFNSEIDILCILRGINCVRTAQHLKLCSVSPSLEKDLGKGIDRVGRYIEIEQVHGPEGGISPSFILDKEFAGAKTRPATDLVCCPFSYFLTELVSCFVKYVIRFHYLPYHIFHIMHIPCTEEL